jgi:hypothetical protein
MIMVMFTSVEFTRQRFTKKKHLYPCTHTDPANKTWLEDIKDLEI